MNVKFVTQCLGLSKFLERILPTNVNQKEESRVLGNRRFKVGGSEGKIWDDAEKKTQVHQLYSQWPEPPTLTGVKTEDFGKSSPWGCN